MKIFWFVKKRINVQMYTRWLNTEWKCIRSLISILIVYVQLCMWLPKRITCIFPLIDWFIHFYSFQNNPKNIVKYVCLFDLFFYCCCFFFLHMLLQWHNFFAVDVLFGITVRQHLTIVKFGKGYRSLFRAISW